MKNKILILFASALLLMSCSSDEGSQSVETIDLFVNHFKTTSLVTLNTVLLVQEEDRIGSDLFIETISIDGFDFVPGFTYELTVERIAIRNPETDFTTTTYRLLSVDRQTPVPGETTFTVPLTHIYPTSFYYSWVRGNQETGYSLNGEIPIDCQGLCGPLGEIENNPPEEVRGVFRHGENGEYILVDLF